MLIRSRSKGEIVPKIVTANFTLVGLEFQRGKSSSAQSTPAERRECVCISEMHHTHTAKGLFTKTSRKRKKCHCPAAAVAVPVNHDSWKLNRKQGVSLFTRCAKETFCVQECTTVIVVLAVCAHTIHACGTVRASCMLNWHHLILIVKIICFDLSFGISVS